MCAFLELCNPKSTYLIISKLYITFINMILKESRLVSKHHVTPLFYDPINVFFWHRSTMQRTQRRYSSWPSCIHPTLVKPLIYSLSNLSYTCRFYQQILQYLKSTSMFPNSSKFQKSIFYSCARPSLAVVALRRQGSLLTYLSCLNQALFILARLNISATHRLEQPP